MMRRFIMIITLGLFCTSMVSAQVKNKLLIVGSYHFANPGLDVNNLEADDVLAPKRQKEILEIVEKLSKFNATRIAVETRYQTKYDTLINELYGKYVEGKHELNNSESQQLGFRLAKRAGHSGVLAVDSRGNFNFGAVMEYAQKNGQNDYIQSSQKWMQAFMAEEQKFMNENPIKDILLRMNAENMLDTGHGQYMKMLQVGKNLDYAGADLVSDWYKRNLRIFSNILRTTENEGERVLLIIGAGHVPILRDLARFHPDWDLISLDEYLDKD